ncbi:hypothetical protein [Dysosmobacter sp.]|uniref:hypothetical protein n=1 Tax=Dysosmobacter sp. TaxID=2591382 RepID=UPI002A9E0EFE|nr:hypothetical protein [Dysosmobacter sp.]MDY5510163.1 hypothetical protein [Dysosmobacter sp.]
MKKKKLKIILAMIALHIVGICAIYGILKFFDWVEDVNPVFGYIVSFIVTSSFFYCYYLFFKVLEHMNDEAEEDDL